MTDAVRQPTSPQPATPASGQVFKRNRTNGYVVECDGNEAKIMTVSRPDDGVSADYWAVGQLISIQVGENRIVGLLYHVESPQGHWNLGKPNAVHVSVELVGEVQTRDDGSLSFSSGISSYPHLGAVAHRMRAADLVAIYKATGNKVISIGRLTQNPEIPAVISVDDLVTRHFAVVGTTGTGKSTAVTLLLHKIVAARPQQRVLILDPHNEFTNAFGNKAITITADELDLPFWVLNLEEFSEVIFRGRTAPAEEIDALREFIPKAKVLFKQGNTNAVRKVITAGSGMTSDTPVPYRIADLIDLLEDEIGSLDGAARRGPLRTLKSRLEAVINDPRFGFLFASKNTADRLLQTLSLIYRMPTEGRPITVFELSGIPSEVVNSVASVLCRLAFDLSVASGGKIQTLVVCEEAHRYIPADTSSGFAPTRSAISKIAKEGRKYGVSLAIITQRPHELDATILSQCNTLFAMRLGNEADQEVMRKAISGSSRSAINFLPSLADREAIAFGRAVSTPMRMMFETLPQRVQPRSSSSIAKSETTDTSITLREVEQMIANMRGDE